MGNQTVGSMSDWSGLLKDLFRQIDDGSIGLEQLRALVNHHGLWLTDPQRFWQELYRKLWNEEYDFSELTIPADSGGFGWVVVVPRGVTTQKVYDKCAEIFPCWKYINGSLDEAVPANDRTSVSDHYAIRFRNRVEADEELKNLSANQLQKNKTFGIVLTERLLLELAYFIETGKHLDISNVTLCSGSRFSVGYVPHVCWSDSGLEVDWCHPDYAIGYLRSRQAVS